MKKVLFLFLMITMGTLHGLAQTFEYTASGITWKCSVTSDETVSIFYFDGLDEDLQELVIPSTVSDASGNTYTVTSLRASIRYDSSLGSAWAFANFTNLTKVVLPKSLRYLDSFVFQHCSKLETVENTENIQCISSFAFSGCVSLTEIDLSHCIVVNYNVFDGCTSLASVALPQCTYIGDHAFSGCTSLASIALPQCTSIKDHAFSGCTSLASIALPQCTSIEENAFAGCCSLASIDLPQCTSIGYAAFTGCNSLASIALPQCTSINDWAFSDCSSLSSIDIPKCITLGQTAFRGCPIRSVTLPSSLTNLNATCFDGFVYVIINATTPPVVTRQSSDVTLFGGNCYIKVPESALDAYRASDGWKSIAKYIFPLSEKEDYFVNVTAQENTSGLSEAIGTDNLQKVLRLKVSGTINGYDIMVIRNKMDNLHYLDLSDAEIVENSYEYYTGCSTKHNEIGDHAFDGLAKLVEIALPKDITRIGAYAFNECNGLRYISLPSKVKEIGLGAFKDCI